MTPSGGHAARPPARVLLLLSSESYRAHDFLDAADRLGVAVAVGSDHRQALAPESPAPTLELDFTDLLGAVERIRELHRSHPLTAVVAAEDEGTYLAALSSEALGLRHNSPGAVEAARRKDLTRLRLREAGLPVPRFQVVPLGRDPAEVASAIPFPCVLKPLASSASRGVIRADTEEQFVAAFERIARLLGADEAARRRPEVADRLLVEEFIPGSEVAVEGLLVGGRLHTVAILDKPDPLDGPYFEETLFVTPSRHPEARQRDIRRAAADAASALGLREGPVHAELRLNDRGEWTVEVAPRSIGGLCARMFRLRAGVSLEELILGHALGLPLELDAGRAPVGVMMIPIPRSGTLGDVGGLGEAREVPGVRELVIRIPAGQQVVALPEGRRYLGFIFADGETPDAVEVALRRAHGKLEIVIEPTAPADVVEPTTRAGEFEPTPAESRSD